MQPESPFRFRRRIAALVTGIAFIIAGCGTDTSGKFGQELFEQTCAVCHGVDGGGTPGRPAIGAGSNAAELSDEQIRGVMQVGPGAMPSFGRLTSAQIDSLVDYLRTLQSVGSTD
jgi:mono/diheme cytochrome c family protein